MDRRSFLTTTSAAAAAAAATAAPLAAADAVAPAAPAIVSGSSELTLAMPWRDSVAGPADQAHRLCRRLETALAGRWRITPRHHDRAGLAPVMAAESDLYVATENHNISLHPAFAFFAALPGAGTFNADDLVAWLRIGGGQELWDDLGAEFGVKPLLVGHLGRWPGLWSTRPVTSLADLDGQRVAVQGLARDVMRGIGAEPVEIAADDLAAALRSGEVAAVEYGGPLTSLALGLPGAARHLNGFGVLEGGVGLSLGIRRSLWDRLGDAERATITAIAAEEAQTSIAEARAHEKPMRRLIRDSHGVAFQPLPADVSIAIDRVSEAVVAHVSGVDRTAERINHSYHAFRNAAWDIDAPPVRAAGV